MSVVGPDSHHETLLDSRFHRSAFTCSASESRFQSLGAKIGGILVWRKIFRQLLVRVNVIAEVTQTMCENLYVELKQPYVMRSVDELCEAPILESLYFAVVSFRASG